MCATNMTKLRRPPQKAPTLRYWVPAPNVVINPSLTLTKWGNNAKEPDAANPLPAPAPAPKYNIKIEIPIYANKGSKKEIGTAHMTLDTTKITLSPDLKSGTVSCEMRELHELVMGGNSYNLHYIGNASLKLRVPDGVHVEIDQENIREYLTSLKVNSKSLISVFTNSKLPSAKFLPRVEVARGTHSVFSPDDLSWWQQLILTLTN